MPLTASRPRPGLELPEGGPAPWAICTFWRFTRGVGGATSRRGQCRWGKIHFLSKRHVGHVGPQGEPRAGAGAGAGGKAEATASTGVSTGKAGGCGAGHPRRAWGSSCPAPGSGPDGFGGGGGRAVGTGRVRVRGAGCLVCARKAQSPCALCCLRAGGPGDRPPKHQQKSKKAVTAALSDEVSPRRGERPPPLPASPFPLAASRRRRCVFGGGPRGDGWGPVRGVLWASVVTRASVFWGAVSPPRAAAVSLSWMRGARWACHPQLAPHLCSWLLPPHCVGQLVV